MRISTKLIALLVSAVLAVMAVYAVVTVSRTHEMLTEELRKMAEHISLALSVGAQHHLEEGDLNGVRRVLETLSRNPDVAGTAVYNLDGRLLAASESVQQLHLAPDQQRLHGVWPEGWFQNLGEHRIYIYLSRILNAEGRPIGSLRLALWERSMLPYALQSRNHILITIGVLAAVLAGLVIYVSRKQIAQPLGRLTAGAEVIGEGELHHRIQAEAGGEIGALADAFNRMAENLEASSRQLISEREHVQNILDSIPEGVLVIHKDSRVTTWNRRLARDFGLTLEEVVGSPLREVFRGVRSRAFWELVDRLRTGPTDRAEVREMTVDDAPGRVFSAIGSPLEDIEGREAGIVLVLIDITERVGLQRQIQQSERLAAVGQLAAGVAHEIGTPLNVISGSAEYLLMRSGEEDASREELRAIVSEVGRITDLVDRLMAFARQKEPAIEPVSFEQVIEAALVLVKPQMEKQRIEVCVDLAPDLPEVTGDRGQLQQIVLNLVMNAWQAMPAGGRLSLAVRRATESDTLRGFFLNGEAAGEWMLFEVADTGEGIAEPDVPKLFDPFYTTKEVGQGTGLGLSIVHRIVEDHGGRLGVTSLPGEGSVFRVLLPIGEA